MFGIFKKQKCPLCGENFEKKMSVKCDGKRFCSAKCAIGHILDLTPKELSYIDFSMFNPEKNIYGMTVKEKK